MSIVIERMRFGFKGKVDVLCQNAMLPELMFQK